jgi:DNA-binding response OmpR family regulator/predicted regulator of Ras-like GTPase activity (Roadblock/LC7/MglB family)
MLSERVLIAHWQEAFAERCRKWLEGEGFEPFVVYTGEEAIALLDERIFDIVLLAEEFPDLDGRAVLRRVDEEMNLPAILVVAGETLSLSLARELTHMGQVEVLELPTEVEDLLPTLWDLLDRDMYRGVRGDLRNLDLPSLITLLCNEGRQALIQIRRVGQRADLFFDRGDLVHATVEGGEEPLVGEDAAYEALSWDAGRFTISVGVAAPEQTIEDRWASVLLEGLRRRDEEAFDQEQLLPEEPTFLPAEPLPFEEPVLDAPPRPRSVALTDDVRGQAEDEVKRLQRELRPRCVLLTDRSGRLVASAGEIEQGRALSLAALLAGSFSATSEVAEMLAEEGEPVQFRQSLQEGEEFSLYSARVGKSWILALAFEPEATLLGMARLYALRTAARLGELLAEQALAPEQQEEMGRVMDDLFREEVGNALEDLFGE